MSHEITFRHISADEQSVCRFGGLFEDKQVLLMRSCGGLNPRPRNRKLHLNNLAASVPLVQVAVFLLLCHATVKIRLYFMSLYPCWLDNERNTLLIMCGVIRLPTLR